MSWNIKVSMILACMIELSSTQEGLFGGFGQSGENGMFGSFSQSGEGGSPFGLLPFIGFGPFGMFGGYGLSRQSDTGGQVASEGVAESAAEPAAEGSGLRQPSWTDINMMLIWNQLLSAGNQDNTPTTNTPTVQNQVFSGGSARPEVSVLSVEPKQTGNLEPYMYSNAADMNWINYFMQ